MIRFQPISVDAISSKELREITDSFGTKALIGEGTYGGVYRGVLSNGQAVAVKKLDTSKQPEQEFLAQVKYFPSDGKCRFFLISVVLLIHFVIFSFVGFNSFQVE